jgi:hypothetical protein
MLFLSVFLVLGLIVPLAYFSAHKFYPELVRKKAVRQLEGILFPEGHWQKSDTLKTCKELTGSRFCDEAMLDYFFKIKGLQTVAINSKTNFWVKKYLFSPTSIKLNYFEQVKFYETFLNLPPNTPRSDKTFHRPEKKERKNITTDYTPNLREHIV